MTTQTSAPPIARDTLGHFRITTPALAHDALAHPAVTAARGLNPMTPPVGDAADKWDAILASPGGKQRNRAVLTARGDDHEYLSGPLRTAIKKRYHDAAFISAIIDRAHDQADAIGSALTDLQSLDFAPLAFTVPAQTGCALFGIQEDAAAVERAAAAQTRFVFGRRRSDEPDEEVEAWQLAGMDAAADLLAICIGTVQSHRAAMAIDERPDTVTADLIDAGMNDWDVTGLVFGVGAIASMEGTGYSVANVIYEMLASGWWPRLAAAKTPREAFRITGPALQQRPGIHTIYRTTDADITLDGVEIPADSTIAVDLLAIRSPFGVATDEHWCVGVDIGRAEAALVPWVLAQRFPEARLVPGQGLQLVDSYFFLGYEHLLVNFR